MNPLDIAQKKIHKMLQFANAVVEGTQTGFYCSGPAGVGKSYNIEKELFQRKLSMRPNVHYHKFIGRISPIGLLDFFDECGGAGKTILFDDVNELFRDKDSATILLAALGRQGADYRDMVRYISYRTNRRNLKVRMEAGVIALSNRPLHSEARVDGAVASRFPHFDLRFTPDEIKALTVDIIQQGKVKLPVGKALAKEAVEYTFAQCVEYKVEPQLRLVFDLILPAVRNPGELHWKDWVDTIVSRLVDGSKLHLTKAEEKDKDKETARKLYLTNPNQSIKLFEPEWYKLTGKKIRLMFDYVRDLKQEGKL